LADHLTEVPVGEKAAHVRDFAVVSMRKEEQLAGSYRQAARRAEKKRPHLEP